jgi:hypothetical protein
MTQIGQKKALNWIEWRETIRGVRGLVPRVLPAA